MGMLKPERFGFEDFADQPLSICGKAFVAHKFGALYWPGEDALIVADLHLEKGSAFAATGQMLPPKRAQVKTGRRRRAQCGRVD